VEMAGARESDGASWANVGEALLMSLQSAHERFHAGPEGSLPTYELMLRFGVCGDGNGGAVSAVCARAETPCRYRIAITASLCASFGLDRRVRFRCRGERVRELA